MLSKVKCNNEAPKTGVFKNNWITLWIITPQGSRNSQQFFRVEICSTTFRHVKTSKHECRNITATYVSCILWCYYPKCYSIILENASLWCFIIIFKFIVRSLQPSWQQFQWKTWGHALQFPKSKNNPLNILKEVWRL